MISPPLATAAATRAICRGVARTSRWPRAVWARAGRSSASPSRGRTEAAVAKSKGMVPLNPAASTAARSGPAPRSMPSAAKAVLQDTASARSRVMVVPSPQKPPSALRMTAVEPGSSSSSRSARALSGVVVPAGEGGRRHQHLERRPRRVGGGEGPVEQGLVRVGGQGVALGRVARRQDVGVEAGAASTRARIAPVAGSRAITAPRCSPRAGGGGPLQVVAQGELHLVGAQVPAEQGEQGGGQRAVVAGAQVGGAGGLDPGVAEVAAGVPGDVAVEVALGVGAHQRRRRAPPPTGPRPPRRR